MNETWRDVVGYEGLYSVSDIGRVKSHVGWNGREYVRRERMMRPTISANGNYLFYVVRLTKGADKKTARVHRLVADAFLPHDETRMIVNHKDFNALNNAVKNLEWCTQAENLEWSASQWRMVSVSEEVANQFASLYDNGASALDIACMSGTPEHVIYRCLQKLGTPLRKSTDHLNKYHIDIHELLHDFKMGRKNYELQEKYMCSKDIIATRKYQFRKQGLL